MGHFFITLFIYLCIYFILIHFILIVPHFVLHTVRLLRTGMDYRVCAVAVSFNYLFLLQLQHTTIDNRAINRGEVFLNGKCRETVQLAGTIPDGKPR